MYFLALFDRRSSCVRLRRRRNIERTLQGIRPQLAWRLADRLRRGKERSRRVTLRGGLEETGDRSGCIVLLDVFDAIGVDVVVDVGLFHRPAADGTVDHVGISMLQLKG